MCVPTLAVMAPAIMSATFDRRPAAWVRAFGFPALMFSSYELVNAAFKDETTFPSAEFYGNELTLEAPEGATVEQVVAPFNLPPKLVHLVLVNGLYVPPEERAARVLGDNDELAVWPPVAGG